MDTIQTSLVFISSALTEAFMFSTLGHKEMLRVRVENIRELATRILNNLTDTACESSESSEGD